MVQLKSFRYIETEGPTSELDQGQQAAPSDRQTAHNSDSATGNHLGAVSINMASANRSSNNSTSSLPSNEEYQLQQIEMGDDDDEDEGGESGDQVNGGIEMSVIETGAGDKKTTEQMREQGKKELRRSLTSESGLVEALQKSQKQARPNTPSLVHLRHQFLAELAQQTANNNKLVANIKDKKMPEVGSFSPVLANKYYDAKTGGDSISQHRPSLPVATEETCFEIKWRNIHLYAKQNNSGVSLSDKISKLIGLSSASSVSSNKSSSKSSLSSTEAAAAATNNQPNRPAGYTTPQLKLRRSISQQSDQLLNIKGLANAATSEPLEEFQNSLEYRPILQNVSGSVFSGQLTAILGPSGVGKSSLLNTLTGRNQLAGIGRVSLLGCSDQRLSVVFVPQWDVLPELLTTIEDLQFTSRLKNPQFSRREHERNVDRVVQLLQLTRFLKVPIKKLSGGQARRLSIGRELLGSPDIMILDEPTSGLDANTCKKIIQALRDLTEQSDSLLDRPMSIIVTIHQPQQEVYDLFHRVYVMAQGGRAIYEGAPGALLNNFLENSALATIVAPDQLNENPAVVALEVASGEYGQTIIDDLARYHEFQHDNNSPLGTPSLYLRSPAKSPLVKHIFSPGGNGTSPLASPILGMKVAAAAAAGSPIIGSPLIGAFPSSRTPKMTPRLGRKNKHTASSPTSNPYHWDSKSIITTVSYASTYDAELPEPVAPKLKVDKRLRRSVVMKGDFLSQTWTLIRRSWLLATRDRFLMLIRILGFLGVAGGTIQIFSETLDPNDHTCPQFVSEVDNLQEFMDSTRDRLQNLKGLLQQNVSNQMFMFNMLSTVLMLTAALAGLVYPIQLRMFLREYKNGWYSPASFITSITISELIVDIIGPVILVGFTYQLCHQPESMYHWREGAYILLIILCALTMKSVSQIVAGFLRNSIEMAVFGSCVCVIFPVLFSGLPVAIGNFPYLLRQITYLSFSRWTFEGLSIARYGYDLCPCDENKINGYPTILDEDTVPKRLHTFSKNLLDYYKRDGENDTTTIATTTLSSILANNITSPTSLVNGTQANEDDNLFSQVVRMATSAANPLIETYEELGTCQSYRSLTLIQLGIQDRRLPQIFLTLGLTFIILRVITYFCVKAVIKLSRSND